MTAATYGWVNIESIKGGAHHYDRGLPACGWASRLQSDDAGHCLACTEALQNTEHPGKFQQAKESNRSQSTICRQSHKYIY